MPALQLPEGVPVPLRIELSDPARTPLTGYRRCAWLQCATLGEEAAARQLLLGTRVAVSAAGDAAAGVLRVRPH